MVKIKKNNDSINVKHSVVTVVEYTGSKYIQANSTFNDTKAGPLYSCFQFPLSLAAAIAESSVKVDSEVLRSRRQNGKWLISEPGVQSNNCSAR